MKRVLAFVVPFALALVLSSAVRADDWTVVVGCQKCNFKDDTKAEACGAACKTADGKVVLLKGDVVKDVKFKEGGEYVVSGKLSEDGKSIEVKEIKKKG
jgi:hypothetical protein